MCLQANSYNDVHLPVRAKLLHILQLVNVLDASTKEHLPTQSLFDAAQAVSDHGYDILCVGKHSFYKRKGGCKNGNTWKSHISYGWSDFSPAARASAALISKV